MLPDADLLHRYAETHSEQAFRALVQQHANLVYAAALRLTGGDGALAEDVGQQVFTQLARKAHALKNHPTLVGWLHRATRFAAIDAVRARQRRRRHEGEALMMNEPAEPSGGLPAWETLRPLLDEALDALPETDRSVVLLRFFEARSFTEVGACVGLSQNAARMRVDRALEKLRRRLVHRGCTSTAAALGSALATQTVVAAPEAWVTAVSAQAVAATAAGGAVVAGASIFAMNKITVAIVAGIAAAGLTTAGLNWKNRWTQRDNASLRAENTALRQLRAARDARQDGAGPTLGEVADRDRIEALSVRLRDYNADAAKQLDSAVKQAKPALQNRGIAAPMAAIETFAWACYTADAAALAGQIYFDGDARRLAEAQLARAPAFLRERYKTPEELYGFFVAADCLIEPPPSDPELLKEVAPVFLQPDRIEMRKKGASRGRHQYQWTAEGWKFVLTAEAVEGIAAGVLRDNPLPTPADS